MFLRMRKQWSTDFSNLQIMVQSWYGCRHVRTMCTYVGSCVTCTKEIDLRHLRVGGGWGGGGGGGQIMLQ